MRAPIGYWNDPARRRQFCDEVAKQYNITRPEQWYQVTLSQLTESGMLLWLLLFLLLLFWLSVATLQYCCDSVLLSPSIYYFSYRS